MRFHLFLVYFEVGGTVSASCLKGILSKMIRRERRKYYAALETQLATTSLHGQKWNIFRTPVPRNMALDELRCTVVSWGIYCLKNVFNPKITINNKHISI